MEGIVKGRLKLQPLTEIVFLISVSVFSFINSHADADRLILLLTALLCSAMGLTKTAVKALLVYAALQLFRFLLLPLLPDVLSAQLSLFVVHGPKLIPIFLAGQILTRTNPVRKIMNALRKVRIPETLTIPLAISIRYFPSLREERRMLADAVRLRDVKGWKRVELSLMPLIITASNTADELAQAIIVRGIENPSRKTFFEDMRPGLSDYAVILFSLGLLIRSGFMVLG